MNTDEKLIKAQDLLFKGWNHGFHGRYGLGSIDSTDPQRLKTGAEFPCGGWAAQACAPTDLRQSRRPPTAGPCVLGRRPSVKICVICGSSFWSGEESGCPFPDHSFLGVHRCSSVANPSFLGSIRDPNCRRPVARPPLVEGSGAHRRGVGAPAPRCLSSPKAAKGGAASFSRSGVSASAGDMALDAFHLQGPAPAVHAEGLVAPRGGQLIKARFDLSAPMRSTRASMTRCSWPGHVMWPMVRAPGGKGPSRPHPDPGAKRLGVGEGPSDAGLRRTQSSKTLGVWVFSTILIDGFGTSF